MNAWALSLSKDWQDKTTMTRSNSGSTKRTSRSKDMNAVELFCGAGGTSLGFHLSGGYRTLLGMDMDPDAMATYANNHPDAVCVTGDITKTPPNSIAKQIKGEGVDIIIGGPSCQGYSTIGKRIASDPRNSLYVHYLKYLDEFRPRWFVFENVRGFLHSGKGRFYNAFCEALAELGYSVSSGVLNAADYGVPQRRIRVILVGTNTGLTPSLPLPTHEDPRCPVCSRPDNSNRLRATADPKKCRHCEGTGRWHSLKLKPWVSVRDAIGNLPWLEDLAGTNDFRKYPERARSDYERWVRRKSRGFTLHEARPVSEFAHSVISKIPPGGGVRSIPEENLPPRFKIMRTVKNGSLRRDCTTLYGRLEWGMPSYTITCYFGNVASGAFTHPEVPRSLTVREAARLQSFPDSYIFNPKNVRRQIGNAVPPLLANAIADHVKRIDDGEEPAGICLPNSSEMSDDKQTLLFA